MDGALFKRADMQRSKWNGIDSTMKANYDGANLAHSSFSASKIMDASFKGAILSSAVFSEVMLDFCSFDGSTIMAGASFGGEISFLFVDMEGLRFDGVTFTQRPGSGISFKGANLKGAALPFAKLDEADFTEVTAAGIDMQGASLNHVDFIKTDLAGANFRDSSLIEADLSGATCTGADFTGSTLCNNLGDCANVQTIVGQPVGLDMRGYIP